MTRDFRYSLNAAAGLGLFMLADPTLAGQGNATLSNPAATPSDAGAVGRDPTLIQIAAHLGSQTANMPVGTIRLRVIPHVGGKAMRERIRWRVMTYGKDDSGKRHQVTEVTEAAPELVLPAGWYVVHAEMRDKTIKHPVEVTAGKTFKYTLVKQ